MHNGTIGAFALLMLGFTTTVILLIIKNILDRKPKEKSQIPKIGNDFYIIQEKPVKKAKQAKPKFTLVESDSVYKVEKSEK